MYEPLMIEVTKEIKELLRDTWQAVKDDNTLTFTGMALSLTMVLSQAVKDAELAQVGEDDPENLVCRYLGGPRDGQFCYTGLPTMEIPWSDGRTIVYQRFPEGMRYVGDLVAQDAPGRHESIEDELEYQERVESARG